MAEPARTTVVEVSENPDEPDEPKLSRAIVWEWKEHIPLLIGCLSLLFVGARLFSISGGDLETADAILQASGTATIIIGAFMPLIGPIFLVVGVALSIVLISGSSLVDFRPKRPLIILALSFDAVVAAIAPVELVIFVAFSLLAPLLARVLLGVFIKSRGSHAGRSSKASAVKRFLESGRALKYFTAYLYLIIAS